MQDTDELTPAQAAAELYKRGLDDMGVIRSVWRKEDSTIVCATTQAKGVHLSNMAKDFDADVHLICDTGEVVAAGNVPEGVPVEEHGSVYFNVSVHGIADDPNGYGLPTHISGPAGATPADREDLPDSLVRLADVAGIDLEG